MTIRLEATNLTKSLSDRRVLDGASLDLSRGELVAVLGPSGAGKTTLFRCLAGLTPLDGGTVTLDGSLLFKPGQRSGPDRHGRIGVVFQQFNLIRRLTSLDNVLAAKLASTSTWRVLTRTFLAADQDQAMAALAAVGLEGHEHQRAATLSGGQQQRVAIARALAQNSSVLLADEPVASLDPETANGIMQLLRRLADETGLAVLCTLHQPELAARYADRVLTMANGQLTTAEPTPANRAAIRA